MPNHSPEQTLRLGRWAEKKAFEIWPDLRPVDSTKKDMAGIDAETDRGFVQIKADLGAGTGPNLYLEIAKAGNGRWNMFGSGGRWHMSPSCAHEYIFVARRVAFRVAVADLMKVPVKQIRMYRGHTSFALLIPKRCIENLERRPVKGAAA